MKILLTGGAGFIGSHLSEKLIAQGHEVVIYDNLTTGKREQVPQEAKLIVGDIRDPKVGELFARENFEAMIHLAAQTGVPASIDSPHFDGDVNILGTINLLEACRTYQVKRVIFASTAAAYGDVTELPVQETTKMQPTSFYGLSKLTVEKYLALYQSQFGLDYVVLRFANVYGERQGDGGEGGVVSIFCRKFFENQSVAVYGDGCQTRDFVYVGDVADAICLALTTNHPNAVYNVSTQTETTVNELLTLLQGIAGKKISATYQPVREGDIFRSFLANDRAQTCLQWKPATPLKLGLEKTYRSLLAN